MKYKRQSKLPHGVEMLGLGEIKSQGDKVIIEGLANKNVIDRGRDIIEVDAWELDNYKKNPVILFNHGMDPMLGGTPIGKATEVTPTDKGLYIKVELSNIDDPVIKRIRGLVQERILRAFSVGFDPKDMEPDSEDSSINRIKKAELFEVSIVGVPMNQDSLFEVSGKMIKRKSLNLLKRDILKRKGAWVAGAVHNRIYEMQKEGVSRDDILSELSNESGLSSEEIMEILAGNVTPVPKEFIEAAVNILAMDSETLERLDSGDAELEGEPEAEEGAPKEEEMDMDSEEEEMDSDKEEMDMDSDKEDYPSEEEEEKQSEDEEMMEEDEEKSLKQADQSDLGVVENNSEIAANKTESENNEFGSPFLDAAKQTNVLLGTLINEIQLLRGQLVKTPDSDEDMEEASIKEEEPVSSDDEDGKEEMSAEEKRLDLYAKRLKNITKRLERISQ